MAQLRQAAKRLILILMAWYASVHSFATLIWFGDRNRKMMEI